MPLLLSLNFKHAALNISFQFFDQLCFKRMPSKMFFVMLLFLEQFQSAANRKEADHLARHNAMWSFST